MNPKNNPLGVEFYKKNTFLSIYVLKWSGMQDLRLLALEKTKFHKTIDPKNKPLRGRISQYPVIVSIYVLKDTLCKIWNSQYL